MGRKAPRKRAKPEPSIPASIGCRMSVSMASSTEQRPAKTTLASRAQSATLTPRSLCGHADPREQARVVGDHAGHAQRLELRDALELAHRPDVELAAGAAHGPDEGRSDEAPVGHDRVHPALAQG